ncbi:hypothetical protein H340_29604 [Streptomyces mobaraensis NBRC 13819 = DSM 40847]|uniref:Uncharacterized protein n=1 Tax=Streptomyces mobaraensis (strain ATCC 29032 / DSM 40847 / JCM 4168 / NBRC 13819 / NCIMB 11159 / IPCR 16-22) TaxID=1223523 RepID=M3ATA4_STRM1|nr:hypothetical protein H340_29604 [Streptomyces mobaraensis NBRC 13819 = DSM 40847]
MGITPRSMLLTCQEAPNSQSRMPSATRRSWTGVATARVRAARSSRARSNGESPSMAEPGASRQREIRALRSTMCAVLTSAAPVSCQMSSRANAQWFHSMKRSRGSSRPCGIIRQLKSVLWVAMLQARSVASRKMPVASSQATARRSSSSRRGWTASGIGQ